MMKYYTLTCIVLCYSWPDDVTFHNCWVRPIIFRNDENLANIQAVDQPVLLTISTCQIGILYCDEPVKPESGKYPTSQTKDKFDC